MSGKEPDFFILCRGSEKRRERMETKEERKKEPKKKK